MVPAKRIDAAKTRLAPDSHRGDLALAFLDDALRAISACPQITRIIVVTGDEAIAQIARMRGAEIIAEPNPAGLNAAVRAGAEEATGPVIAIAADLPALTPKALACVLELAETCDRALLCDAQGTGTAMLLAAQPEALHPMFGEGSRARHVNDGCTDLGLDVRFAHALAPARRDVDTAVDLADAVRIGVGMSTQDALGISD